MTLPASLNIKTTFNLAGLMPMFNLQCLTDFNAESVPLNNIKQNFNMVNPQGIVVYDNSSLSTPDLYTFPIVSITRSGAVATVTSSVAHGMITGDWVIVGGADQSGYNIIAQITKVSSTVFTYTVAGGPATPATGTIFGHKMSLNTVQIPLDSATGFPIQGSYIITMTTVVSGIVQPGTYTKSFTYTYGYVRPAVTFNQSVNCFLAEFFSTDTTVYRVDGIQPTFSSYAHNVSSPSESNIPVHTSVLQTIQINAPEVWNGSYVSSVIAYVSYTFADGLVVYDKLTGSEAFVVACDINLCKINCCINSLNERYENELATNLSLAVKTGLLLTRTMQLAQLFAYNISCGNAAGANSNLAKLYEITGCTGDCSGCNTGPVIPYVGFIGKTILAWNQNIANSQDDYINFENSLFQVLENTNAGQSPTTDPDLFQLIGIGFYNSTNTQTGTNAVTLNTRSGKAIFTAVIDDNTVAYFTINNTFFKAGQKINPEIEYDNQEGGNGSPSLNNYSIIDGQVIISVSNIGDGNPTGTPMGIKFNIQ